MSISGSGGGGGLTRIRSSSSASSSTQVTLNAQLKQPQQRKTLLMPPSVMPALNTTTTSRGKNTNYNNMKLAHAFSTAPELSSLRKNFKTKSNNEDESLHLMTNENIMSGGGGGDLNSNHNSTKA